MRGSILKYDCFEPEVRGLQRSFQHRFCQLLHEPVLADDILRLLVTRDLLVYQLPAIGTVRSSRLA